MYKATSFGLLMKMKMAIIEVILTKVFRKSIPQNRPLEVFQPLVEPGNVKSNREQVDRLSPHVGLIAGIKGHKDHKGQVGNNRHHSLDDLNFPEGCRHLLLIVSDVSNSRFP